MSTGEDRNIAKAKECEIKAKEAIDFSVTCYFVKLAASTAIWLNFQSKAPRFLSPASAAAFVWWHLVLLDGAGDGRLFVRSIDDADQFRRRARVRRTTVTLPNKVDGEISGRRACGRLAPSVSLSSVAATPADRPYPNNGLNRGAGRERCSSSVAAFRPATLNPAAAPSACRVRLAA
jgi:hypothetical protein